MEEIRRRMADIVQFLSEHRWIYDIQITRLFADQWWKTIPSEWREPLTGLTVDELNQLPFGFIKAEWPSSLKTFILQSQELSLSRSVPPSVAAKTVHLPSKIKAGMTPKKAHEVSHLAGVVKEVCATSSYEIVLDIGSGLGYLGDCLCEQCGVCVVGVERETERLTAAKKREHFATQADENEENGESCDQQGRSCDPQATSWNISDWNSYLHQVLPVDLKSPFHVSLQLNVDNTQQSKDKFSQLLLHLQGLHFMKGDLHICVVGLHCCGDLTPSILTLFTEHTLPNLTALVLIGCCYHKTDSPQWSPISTMARELMKSREDLVSTYALRLAAQETRERWQCQSSEEHSEHERRVAYRGMLEAVGSQCHGKNLPRKALRRLKITSIEDYAKAVATNLNDPCVEDQLLTYYTAHESFVKLIEPFTALQVCVQGVLERLVLEDRLSMLTERGIHSAKLVPTFDPSISPRNMAVVATKT